MTWTLPIAEHETFARNPLEAVICQLRFAPILKVHARVPDFQDAIRSRFPGYEETEGLYFEVSQGLPRQRTVRQYRFSAKKEPTVALLGDQGVTLEYRDHRDRAELLRDASLVFGALDNAYRPVSPQRLGLRYVNLIDLGAIRRDLGRDVEWTDLVAPEFLSLPTGLADLTSTRYASEITSPLAPGKMTVRLGLLPQQRDDEVGFRLDIDRFTEEDFSVDDVETLLSQFAADIYQVFRAASRDALIDWMKAK